jgi:sugar O-acyltransferase (sialic acid O-acetyltransferase NeuD family)
MKTIAIYGAGGFGREVNAWLQHATLVADNQFIGFLDDDLEKRTVPSTGKVDNLVVAIAAPLTRKEIVTRIGSQYTFPKIIHTDISVADNCVIDRGSILCSGVKLTTDIQVGEFVIINLNVVVGHDVRIGSFASIMPSANILGGVTIGEGAFIGAGAIILQNLKIGAGAIVGAGAVVTKSVSPGKKIVGVPGREI